MSTRETEWDPPPLQHLSSQERQEMLTIYDTVFVHDTVAEQCPVGTTTATKADIEY